MKVILGPTNEESSNEIIKVSEADLPKEVLYGKFDQVKITMRKSTETLLNYGVRRISLNGSTKLSLREAAEKGNIEEVKSSLSCGADVNE